MDLSNEPASRSTIPGPGEPNRLFAGRFRVERLLKEGNGVATYLAYDVNVGDDVVLKIATDPADSEEGGMRRLRHEAAVLQRLAGIKTSPLRAVIQTADYVALAYPFFRGVPLGERIRLRPLTALEAVRLGIALFSALDEAHAVGVLHGDVKPSNILIPIDAPLTEARLIDYGFALTRKALPRSNELLAGTARYLSPERSGLIKRPIDIRSDLYSAGIVLYEALTGRNPIGGTELGEVLRNHLLRPPQRLRSKNIEVPESLDEVIQHLIQREPRDRYQTAQGVLADLTQLERALARGQFEVPLAVGAADRRSALTEPAFTGRKRELGRLIQWLEDARRGVGGLVLLEAESGGGKTRLLEEFANLVGDAWVIWGQGVDRTSQSPFQLLSGLCQAILEQARASKGFADRLRDKVGAQGEALSVAFPELRPIFGVAPAGSPGPEAFGEIRTLQALSVLLDALGTPQRPVLLILDDCQWADALTLKALTQWNRRRQTQESACPVLTVAAFRSEEVLLGHPFRRIQPLGHLHVPRFQRAEVLDLIRSMAGPLPEEASALVAELADGSPFMAGAVLRGLVEIGALRSEADHWTFHHVGLPNLSSSRRAAALLVRRLELLPERHVQLLSTAAILGKEFSLELAAELCSIAYVQAVAIAEEARRRHIVWTNAGSDRCSFVHDKIREALLGRLSESERIASHERVARHLEAHHPESSFELAYHWDSAGASVRAFLYALTAAEQARERHSLQTSAQLYEIALRGAGEADEAQRRRLARGYGELLLLLGRYDDSETQFRSLLELARNDLERATIAGRLGEIAFKRGDLATSASTLEKGLVLLGRPAPRSPLGYALRLLYEVCVQALHTWFPKRWVGRRTRTPDAEVEFVEMRLLSRLAYTYWFEQGSIPCGWAHLRELNLAERYGPSAELAQAYSEHAPVSTLIPWFKRGETYARRSFLIRQSLGDLWGQGQSLGFHGAVLYSASRYEDAVERCREAIRILERTGDRWEVNLAGWHLGFALYRLGERQEAVRVLKRVHLDAIEIGDLQASGISLGGWSRAALGKVPSELIAAELRRPGGDVHTRVEVLMAEAVRLLSTDPASATNRLEEAVRLFRKARLRQEYVVAVYPWLATSLRRQLEEARQDLSPFRSRRLARRQRGAVRRALSVSRWYRNGLPHSLREAGLYWAARGKTSKARGYLDRSLSIAIEQEAKAEEYDTRLVRLRLGRELRWSTFAEDQTAVDEFEHAQNTSGEAASLMASATASISLIDRFETLLHEGRAVLQATTRETVVRAAESTATALLRAEFCRWMPASALSEPPSAPVSRELVRQAFEQRQPVTTVEGLPADAASESVILGGIRSALCAPVIVGGEVVGGLYVAHRGVSGLFGEEEKQLAGFLAALVSVSLENATAIERLRELGESRRETIEELQSVRGELESQAVHLKRSNEDLQNFAFAASHDLKDPLRLVSSYLQLVQRRLTQGPDPRFDEDVLGFIDHALRGANHMFELIDGILSYSRVRGDESALAPMKLDEVLDKVLAALQPAISQTGATIHRDPLPELRIHPIQIGQVFQNLIGNALKFRAAKAPEIAIRCRRLDAGWRIEVSDNGIGIDPRYAERIFAMFKRLHARDAYPGSGIGLALCRRVIELHGGRIGVESQVDQGATFWFELPETR